MVPRIPVQASLDLYSVECLMVCIIAVVWIGLEVSM
jgi:hypothetical protein